MDIINKKDNLCKLKINKADEDEHQGMWNVVVMGKCRNRRNKRQAISSLVGTPQEGNLGAEPKVSITNTAAEGSKPVIFPNLGSANPTVGVSFNKDDGYGNNLLPIYSNLYSKYHLFQAVFEQEERQQQRQGQRQK